MAGQEKIKKYVPTLTLFVIGVSMAVYSFPRLSSWLVYDRQAILNGEIWRLITAPFVHFSASHLFWDAAAFGAAGWAIEAAGYGGFLLVCGFAAVTPGLLFLAASPELHRYGGLSGLAIGAVAYLCLCSALSKDKKRFIWLAILAAAGLKVLLETAMEGPMFAWSEDMPFRVLPAAHFVGYLGALIAVAWKWPRRRSSSLKG